MSMTAAFFMTTAKAEAGGALLLDLFGTNILAAYSLRKLSSTYSGDAVRVRRTSDNAEQDIGFNGNGDFDTSSLTTFLGSDDGFLAKWYDQSGNSRDGAQTNANKQIRIATAGTIETKNSLPTTQGASNDHLTVSGVPTTSQPITTFDVYAHFHPSNAGTTATWVSKVDSTNMIRNDYKRFARMGILSKFGGTSINAQGATAHGDTDLHVVTRMMNGASSILRVDQVAEGRSGGGDFVISGAQMGSVTTIGTNGTDAYNGQLSELLIFAADKTSEITNIEDNLKTYYSTP
jgi:hypothetical protein